MKFKLIILTLAFIGFNSCNVYSQKTKKKKEQNKKQQFEHAILKKGVSAAADGCGWMIEFPKTKKSYKFVEMPQSFELKNNLEVELQYEHIEEKYLCGRGRAKIDQIKILEVRIYTGKKKKK